MGGSAVQHSISFEPSIFLGHLWPTMGVSQPGSAHLTVNFASDSPRRMMGQSGKVQGCTPALALHTISGESAGMIKVEHCWVSAEQFVHWGRHAALSHAKHAWIEWAMELEQV